VCAGTQRRSALPQAKDFRLPRRRLMQVQGVIVQRYIYRRRASRPDASEAARLLTNSRRYGPCPALWSRGCTSRFSCPPTCASGSLSICQYPMWSWWQRCHRRGDSPELDLGDHATAATANRIQGTRVWPVTIRNNGLRDLCSAQVRQLLSLAGHEGCPTFTRKCELTADLASRVLDFMKKCWRAACVSITPNAESYLRVRLTRQRVRLTREEVM
jgi:hypothetical protein